eukprot:3467943-Amphidinium_carterae.3
MEFEGMKQLADSIVERLDLIVSGEVALHPGACGPGSAVERFAILGVQPQRLKTVSSASLREASVRVHFQRWWDLTVAMPHGERALDFVCSNTCVGCVRFGARSPLDYCSGGSPCYLLAVFGHKFGGVVACPKCQNNCHACLWRRGPIGPDSSCMSSWCSAASAGCLEDWMNSLAPICSAWYEILHQPTTTRDYVFRGIAAGIDASKLLVDVPRWQEGESLRSEWIGGYPPVNNLGILKTMQIDHGWSRRLITHAATTYRHELIATCIVLSELDDSIRDELLELVDGYAIEFWHVRLKTVLNLAHRFRLFNLHSGPGVRKLKGLGKASQRRDDAADWASDALHRQALLTWKIDPVTGSIGDRVEQNFALAEERLTPFVEHLCTHDMRNETVCLAEGLLLDGISDGSTCSRENFTAVCNDTRYTGDERPGKYASYATAPRGILAACMAVFPSISLSLSTKREPEDKRRVLAACRDRCYIVEAAAARGFEKRIVDRKGRLVLKQGPEDVMDMLLTTLDRVKEHPGLLENPMDATAGPEAPDVANIAIPIHHEGFSLDYKSYNENEEVWEVRTISLVLAQLLLARGAYVRGAMWLW